MLVLSRKQGESIQIAENVMITVSEVRGGRVKLTIEAPKSVRVMRREIELDAKQLLMCDEPLAMAAAGSGI